MSCPTAEMALKCREQTENIRWSCASELLFCSPCSYEYQKLSDAYEKQTEKKEGHGLKKVREAELARSFLIPRDEVGNTNDVAADVHQV